MSVRRDPLVKILLCVHDGEPYLDELVASIRSQEYVNWELLVCDDGSSDDGLAIVERHAVDDRRVSVVERRSAGEALGPAQSYMRMLEHVGDDDLFAFCDQDDVWFTHKLSWTVEALMSLRGEEQGRSQALRVDGPRGSVEDLVVVCTDAEVTDARLELTAPSALTQHQVRGEVTFGRLLINNVAIGATLVGTASVARTACELGRELDIRMHDWWCALVAAYGGSFAVLAAPTMSWRRHGGNVTGHSGGTIGERVDRRLGTLSWSVAAARALTDGLDAVDEHTAIAAASILDVDPARPTIGDLRRMRRAGVVPWSRTHAANLLGAAILSKSPTTV